MFGSSSRKFLWPLLFLLGLLLWLNATHGYWGRNSHLYAGLIAGILAAIPAVNRKLSSAIDFTRRWSTCRWRVFSVVTLLGGVYFVLEAFLQHRQLGPGIEDESSILLQIAMFAHGRFWLPSHALADFFDSYYIFVRPVYASIYFPGTALLYVPGYWLGMPTWGMPVVRAALTVGFTYLVVAELVDEPAGLLAALLLLSTSGMRFGSVILISHAVMMLAGMVVLWTYLRWRRDPTWLWATAAGVAVGWAATVRPLDALAYCLPIAIAAAWRMRSLTRRLVVRTFLATAIGALPFVAIQLTFNKGITGRWTTSPYTAYVERYLPGFSIALTHRTTSDFTPDRLAADTTPKKASLYQQFASWIEEDNSADELGEFWRHQMPRAVSAAVPNGLLLIFIPLALLAWNNDRWIPLTSLTLFLLAYQLYPLFLLHYVLPIIPLAAASVAMGVRTPWNAPPGICTPWTTCATVTTIVFCLAASPRVDRLALDEWYAPGNVRRVERAIRTAPDVAIIVLFDNSVGGNKTLNEFVYNFSTPWPDDARVIRAHDLGPRNVELFNYYAVRQPNRVVYYYEQIPGTIKRLGKVSDLANKTVVPFIAAGS